MTPAQMRVNDLKNRYSALTGGTNMVDSTVHDVPSLLSLCKKAVNDQLVLQARWLNEDNTVYPTPFEQILCSAHCTRDEEQISSYKMYGIKKRKR